MEKPKRQKTGGRRKGSVNKITKEVRGLLQEVVNNNLCYVDSWLKRTAEEDPREALKCFISLAEFVIPKKSREKREEGGDYIINISSGISAPPPNSRVIDHHE